MVLPNFVRYTFFPLALIVGCPLLIVIFNHIIQNLNGSLNVIYNEIQGGLYEFIIQKCILNNFPTLNHFLLIFIYYISQIILYYIIPGKTTNGPATPTGYIPRYKQNGIATYLVSLLLVIIGYFVFNIPFHQLINHITPLIIAICIISWIITFILLFCALCCPQNPRDTKFSGNPILDYWRGWELYPYWFGINCKQLINSRIGMTQWALICLCYILCDYDNNVFGSGLNMIQSPVFISGILQIIYLFKFFYWEIGYFGTLDVMHDRCGFYISWGCLSWVFSVYTFHTGIILSYRLTQTNYKTTDCNILTAVIIFIIGILSIYINYSADEQKIRVRNANGNCKIFGKKAKIIRATYVTENGKNKKSILLVSGYWGFARHFHYVPELIFAAMICIPGITVQSSLQLFYFIYLFILLADRTGRDDQRCSKKYGKYWKEYCKQVKYKMIPFIW